MTEDNSNVSFMKSCGLVVGVLDKWDPIYVCTLCERDSM